MLWDLSAASGQRPAASRGSVRSLWGGATLSAKVMSIRESGSMQSRHWSQGFCSMPSAGLPGPSVTLRFESPLSACFSFGPL